MIKSYGCDVLIIGAGAAGIRAAIESQDAGGDVLVAVKGGLCESGSSFYAGTPGWGLCAAVQPGDSSEKHKNEILSLAKGTADEELAGILTEHVKERIDDLEAYGIEFKKNSDGSFLSVKPCFAETERSVSARGMDKIRGVFYEQVKKRDIKVLQNFPVLGLLHENGTCCGAYGIKGGSLVQISANSVVLATGGGISLFSDSYSIGDLSGDGYSMALDAGAHLTNLEFIQFIPATKKPKKGCPFEQRALNYLNLDKSKALACAIESLSGNKADEVLKARSTHGPFSTRDIGIYFDEALYNDSKEDKTLYFDEGMSKSGNWVAKKLRTKNE